MFDEFGIKNFKSWKDETFFPIKDINLLFGPNSSGKSSVIQSLLLLFQSVRASTITFWDFDRPNLGKLYAPGEHRDFGDIDLLSHKRSKEPIIFIFRKSSHFHELIDGFLLYFLDHKHRL